MEPISESYVTITFDNNSYHVVIETINTSPGNLRALVVSAFKATQPIPAANEDSHAAN